jgi:MraZ protein
VVLTAHPDRCLLLYPRAAFAPISAKVSTLSSFSEQARWWQRLLVGFAEEVELDGSGRILVSPALRRFADFKKNVMLVGQGSHFELWDVAVWDRKLEEALAAAGSTPPPGTDNFAL